MDTELGFFVIIAFLLGMGTPLLPKRKAKDRRNGEGRRTSDPSRLDEVYDLLELIIRHNRPPGPGDTQPEDPEDGGT